MIGKSQGYEHILNQIISPSFPEKTFVITDYGAIAKFNFDSRKAIQTAIDECSKSGGGKVIIPSGNFFTSGSIFLKNNVNLHLEENAHIKFGRNYKNYLPNVKVRWAGTICYNYSPLIYAYQQKNIAITGKGTLDGNNPVLKSWLWAILAIGESSKIREAGENGTPHNERIFGHVPGNKKHKKYHFRPTFIEFYECENILLSDFLLTKTRFWSIHPVFSQNITIRNITIKNNIVNDDGIDPDGCKNVLIENCTIKTIDDCIAVKSGRDRDGWDNKPCENIIVRNCSLHSGGYPLCVGSDMSGGVKNFYMENCKINFGFHAGFSVKANLDRGGTVENIYINGLTIKKVHKAAFDFRMNYPGYRGHNFPPKYKDILIENVNCEKVKGYGIRIRGVENTTVDNISFKNITINKVQKPVLIYQGKNISAKNVKIEGVPVDKIINTNTKN